MFLLSLLRFFAGLVSLLILAAAIYLLASWYAGDWISAGDGRLVRERDDWRLWAGLGLMAWSCFGWFLAPLLVGTRDEQAPSTAAVEGRELPQAGGIFVESHGPQGAPTILFTHGWGMDARFWDWARAGLSDRFRLEFWDLPGLGRSRRAEGSARSLEAMAVALAGVIEAAAGRRVVLVGHSIGGMVIQTLMRLHPELADRVAGAVLLHTTFANPLRTMLFGRLWLPLQKPLLEPAERLTIALSPLVWAWKWQSWLSGSTHLAMRAGFGRKAPRRALSLTALLVTKAMPATEARGNLAMMNWSGGDAVRNARFPVLVVGGDVDIVTKAEASRALASQSPLARLDVRTGANHMGPVEDPKAYNALIADFTLAVQDAAAADGGRRRAIPRPRAEAGAPSETRPTVP